MATTAISAAARLLRAGNAYSESNRKLREATDTFINWLFNETRGCEPFPGSLGWYVAYNGNGQRWVQFPVDNRLVTVTADWKDQRIRDIRALCDALAGDPGAELIQWLEDQTAQNRKYNKALTAFVDAIYEQ